MIDSVIDAANVEDCNAVNNNIDNNIETQYAHENVPRPPQPSPYDRKQTGCSSNPCRNNGLCYPLSPIDYRCACVNGHR